MSLYNDISPQILMIIGITLAIIFVLILLRICCEIRVFKDQAERVQGLLLSNMLDRFNIAPKEYFRKTSDMDKERHIWVCEHCPEPDECEHMFWGKILTRQAFAQTITN